jgi:hypothetical protein
VGSGRAANIQSTYTHTCRCARRLRRPQQVWWVWRRWQRPRRPHPRSTTSPTASWARRRCSPRCTPASSRHARCAAAAPLAFGGHAAAAAAAAAAIDWRRVRSVLSRYILGATDMTVTGAPCQPASQHVGWSSGGWVCDHRVFTTVPVCGARRRRRHSTREGGRRWAICSPWQSTAPAQRCRPMAPQGCSRCSTPAARWWATVARRRRRRRRRRCCCLLELSDTSKSLRDHHQRCPLH